MSLYSLFCACQARYSRSIVPAFVFVMTYMCVRRSSVHRLAQRLTVPRQKRVVVPLSSVRLGVFALFFSIFGWTTGRPSRAVFLLRRTELSELTDLTEKLKQAPSSTIPAQTSRPYTIQPCLQSIADNLVYLEFCCCTCSTTHIQTSEMFSPQAL